MSQSENSTLQRPSPGDPDKTSPSIPVWVSVVALLGAFLLATGAVIALVHPQLLVSPKDDINSAARVYAGYLASRNLALAVVLVAALLIRARASLSTTMLIVAVVQGIDVCMDCIEGRWAIIPGIIVFGVAFVIAAARLSHRPLWTRGA